MRFLFWNLNGKSLAPLVAAAAAEHAVDMILLGEARATRSRLASPGMAATFPFHPVSNEASKIAVFTRLAKGAVLPIHDVAGMTFLRVLPDCEQEFLLVGVHLGSKMHLSEGDQIALSQRWADRVEDMEGELGRARTVVVGDFNMNPFEPGIVSGLGFHAVMTRSRAEKGDRKIQGENSRRFFYNPMWRHFGDRDDGPPGTYHRQSSAPVCYYWNIFDQVLVRPTLLSVFNDASVRILTAVDERSLLTAGGVPSKRAGSDHLPLLFDLNVAQPKV